MTYDYHGNLHRSVFLLFTVLSSPFKGAWDNVTGINAPLFGSDVDDENEEWKNVVGFRTISWTEND